MKQAKTKIPLIATALAAVIAVLWFLSISRFGNTGFQKFAEAKQSESAKADTPVTGVGVEPGPDHPESPLPQSRGPTADAGEDATGLPPPSAIGSDSAATGANSSNVLVPLTQTPTPTPLELVWIPPGTFVMGSSPYEKPEGRYEGPETSVTISYGFWLGKYEVTIWQYRSTAGRLPRKWLGRGLNDQDNDLPVDNVEWQEAGNFCRLLTQQEREAGTLPPGYVYRLPSEAEWEYACRAGTNTRFSFGDDLNYFALQSYGWFAANSEGRIHPVGGKLPNPWGLYDMHGNVTEWCLDWLGEYPGGAVTNPLGTIPGSVFARRGGCFRFDGYGCRSASRGWSIMSDTSEFGRGRGSPAIGCGFRVVLAPPFNPPE